MQSTVGIKNKPVFNVKQNSGEKITKSSINQLVPNVHFSATAGKTEFIETQIKFCSLFTMHVTSCLKRMCVCVREVELAMQIADVVVLESQPRTPL